MKWNQWIILLNLVLVIINILQNNGKGRYVKNYLNMNTTDENRHQQHQWMNEWRNDCGLLGAVCYTVWQQPEGRKDVWYLSFFPHHLMWTFFCMSSVRAVGWFSSLPPEFPSPSILYLKSCLGFVLQRVTWCKDALSLAEGEVANDATQNIIHHHH